MHVSECKLLANRTQYTEFDLTRSAQTPADNSRLPEEHSRGVGKDRRSDNGTSPAVVWGPYQVQAPVKASTWYATRPG